MSPLELVDDRFEKLAAELRASRPVASAGLRERVAELGGHEPAPRFTFRLPPRRAAVALAAVALLGSFAAAAITGLTGSDGSGRTAVRGEVARSRTVPQNAAEHGSQTLLQKGRRAAQSPPADDLAPTRERVQRYEATLRLRVEDVDALSSATKRAMSLARSLGGYVGSVQYSTRDGRRGGATIVLRVPIGTVQTALGRLTSLGTILQQRTGILDVTRRVGREARQIAKLERALAGASPEQAPAIRLKLKTLRTKHARLVRSARLARIVLGLSTPVQQAAAAPSRFDRTLDDAASVLLRELEILLYVLVVAGPLLLLGGAGIATARAQRRRADARLLERS